ncbi:hypothetical protein ABFS83_08G203300 [Erythranthe nasuta]
MRVNSNKTNTRVSMTSKYCLAGTLLKIKLKIKKQKESEIPLNKTLLLLIYTLINIKIKNKNTALFSLSSLLPFFLLCTSQTRPLSYLGFFPQTGFSSTHGYGVYMLRQHWISSQQGFGGIEQLHMSNLAL